MSMDARSMPEPRMEPEPSYPVLSTMRVLGLVIGLILILIGVYFGILILGDVLGLLRDPVTIESPLKTLAAALDLDGVTLELQGKPVKLGRMAAVLILFVGYWICSIIAMKTALAGGRLIAGFNTDRREFYAAARALGDAVRQGVR